MLPPSWKSDVQKAVEEKIGADRVQRQAQQSEASAKIAAAIEALSDAQNTQTAHDDRNEKINVWLAVITIFLVFLTVVFTGASWWVFSGQLNEMRTAADQTNKIIEANTKLVDAATKQAAAAAENAQIARDNFVASQRAWVGPRNVKSSSAPTKDQDLPIMLEYGNTGREPAIETIHDTDIFTATEAEDNAGVASQRISAFIKKCKVMWKPDQAEVVYPSVGLSAANYTLTIPMQKSDVDDDVISGEKTIFFSGCFSYKTTETIHRSWFCFFYKAPKTLPGNWNICPTGNGAD
jgi:hypothetical protein